MEDCRLRTEWGRGALRIHGGTHSVLALREGQISLIFRAMDIHLTPDQKAFACRAIENGRLHSEQDAGQEALALWEERERRRAEFLLTLADAKASLARC